MTFALLVIVGLVIGWADGRLLALTRSAVTGDLVWGVLGAVIVGWTIRATQTGGTDTPAVALLGAAAGALAITFVRRTFTDRYRRAIA